MQRYATAVFFAAFALGILVCRYAWEAVWIVGALVAAGTGFFLNGRCRGLAGSVPVVAAFVVAVFFAGAWRGNLYFAPLERTVSHLTWYATVDYRATVAEIPAYASNGRQRYIRLEQVRLHPEQAAILPRYAFTMAVPVEDTFSVGDVVAGRAVLLPLRAPLSAEQTDFRTINHRKGVVGQLYDVSGCRVVGRDETAGTVWRARAMDCIRGALLRCGVSEPATELTLAVVLGDKSAVDPQTRQAYRLSGAMHLLVVSGLHVGIIAGMVFLLTGFLSKRRKWRAAAILAVLWGYGFLAGYSPAVLRALWMYTVLVLSGFGRGRYFSFSALCLAGWLDLVVRPQDVYSSGFQMSYAATAALVLSYEGLGRIGRKVRPAVFKPVVRLLLVALVAQAALAPFVLFYFDSLNLLFPLTNLLLVPLVSYAVIPAGLLLCVLSVMGVSFPLLAWGYNRLTDLCTTMAAAISRQETFVLSQVGLSLSGTVWAVFLCAGVFLWRRTVKGALAVMLTGGIVACAARLGADSPYPYIGVDDDGGYVVEMGRAKRASPSAGSLVSCAGRTLWVFPRQGQTLPQGRCVLLAREYFEPQTAVETIVLAADTPWSDAARWRAYARKQKIVLHDMREKGIFPIAPR